MTTDHDAGPSHAELIEVQLEELHRAEAQISALSDRYRTLFARVPVAMLTIGNGGAIRQANDAARTLLTAGEPLDGKPLALHVVPDDHAVLRGLVRHRDGSARQTEAVFRDRLGTRIPCHVRSTGHGPGRGGALQGDPATDRRDRPRRHQPADRHRRQPQPAHAEPSASGEVELELRDDGHGMAMVTSFVQASHGELVIHTAPASGTTSSLTLPAVQDDLGPPVRPGPTTGVDHHVDVVLSDVVLGPDMDGLTLRRRLAPDPSAPPVVPMSGHGYGRDDVLPKPFTAAQLLGALGAALAGDGGPA